MATGVHYKLHRYYDYGQNKGILFPIYSGNPGSFIDTINSTCKYNKAKAVVNNYLLQMHNIKQIQYSQVNYRIHLV